VLDGEAVVLGVTGDADFDALHSRRHDHEVQLYAFDMLAGDGDDYRQLPLSMRKTNLQRLMSDSRNISLAGHKGAGQRLYDPSPARKLWEPLTLTQERF
jgi:ATP-dependent DNA ligase